MTDRNRLIYLPLGGAGEIGVNAYVYGYGPVEKERLIVVDLGVGFPDMDGQPGVDLILPDIAWLEARRDRIDAIFITHAHEDHVGAVGHLWSRLRAPIHCRAFTAIHAKRKLEDAGQSTDPVHVAPVWPGAVKAGPFTVQFAPVSHSIPEASALVIDTPVGRVVHSGDFKIDRNPIVGEAFDEDLWRQIGQDGVLAYICDSTNIFTRHPGRSESQLPEPIGELIAGAKGLVVATTFASNIARLKTLADAGVANGRSICLMGRAMKRMVSAGQEAGVLTNFPRTLSPEEALDVPRENLMLIVTGSQGERRAASASPCLSRARPSQAQACASSGASASTASMLAADSAGWPCSSWAMAYSRRRSMSCGCRARARRRHSSARSFWPRAALASARPRQASSRSGRACTSS